MVYKVIVVGAGLVGEQMIAALRSSKIFYDSEIKVLATRPRMQNIQGEEFQVKEAKLEEFEGYDLALFAGTEGEGGASKTLAQGAIRAGVTVIDNGSDYRLHPRVPLVIPEINPEDLKDHLGLISNPNCATIQMLVPLTLIHRTFILERINVVTFQAVSGTGKGAIKELVKQIYAITRQYTEEELISSFNQLPFQNREVFPFQIAFNIFPHLGSFSDMDYTSEELKAIDETHKIFHNNSIAICPTCVRVPVLNCHSEVIYIETDKEITAEEAREIFAKTPGVVVQEPYLTPMHVSSRDEVFVGRVRDDIFYANAICFWSVTDNLWKGAALNAVQIAEEIVRRDLLKRTKELKLEDRFKDEKDD